MIDRYVDPNEPPMPGKITATEAGHMAEALAKRTQGRGYIALTLFRDTIRELI